MALLALAMVATVWLLVRRRSGAAAAAAVAVLAKLLPVLALPMWARQARRPIRFWIVTGLLLAVVLVPLLVALGGAPPGLVRYGVSWEFNGPLYEPLWRALEWASVDAGLKGGLDWLKQRTGWHEPLNTVYPFVYPQLLAKALLAGLLLVFVGRSLRESDPIRGTGRLFGGVLLCVATLYPGTCCWSCRGQRSLDTGPGWR